MGSHNLTDPFVGSIRSGDECVLIILDKTFRRNGANGSVVIHPQTHFVSNEGPSIFYSPIGAIHGKYGDCTDMDEIQAGTSGEALAKVLGISQKDLVTFLSIERERSLILNSSFLDPKMRDLLYASNTWTREKQEPLMTALGFVRDPERMDTWKHTKTGYTAYLGNDLIFEDPSKMKGRFASSDFFVGYSHKPFSVDFYLEWAAWSGEFAGFPDTQQVFLASAFGWSGMWILKETWEAFGGSALDSEVYTGRDNDLDLNEDTLPEIGFIQNANGHWILPQMVKDSEGNDLSLKIVNVERSFTQEIRFVRGDMEERVFGDLHGVIQAYHKATGKKPKFSILEGSPGRVRVELARMAMRISRTLEARYSRRLSILSPYSVWTRYIHNGGSKILFDFYLDGDLLDSVGVRTDLEYMVTMSMNLYLLGRMFFPASNGPQCGDLVAEYNASQRLAKISHDRIAKKAKDLEITQDFDLKDGFYPIEGFFDEGFFIVGTYTNSLIERVYIPCSLVFDRASSRDPSKIQFVVKGGGWYLKDKE